MDDRTSGSGTWLLDTDGVFSMFMIRKKLLVFLALQNLVGELEVTNIAVLKAYQGRGYASQLMKHFGRA